MTYTEEEIKKYLNILHNYNKRMPKSTPKFACCKSINKQDFTIYSGLKICNECGSSHGHVLGYFDLKDYDRLHYRKKSIYYRKYHYQKKVDYIQKLINLDDEEKFKLYEKLLSINNYNMSILNKQYFRKRMININYLSKKLLEEMKCEKHKLIILKISPETLKVYEQWWISYKKMN